MITLKTLRIKLRTGETILRKDIEEFFIGKLYLVYVSKSSGPVSHPIDNVLNLEYFKNGSYSQVFPLRRDKWIKA